MSDIQSVKQAMRTEYSARRAALPPETRKDYDRRLVKALIADPAFVAAKALLCTLSTPEELDTAPMIEAAWAMSKPVAVPRCLPGRQMGFYIYDDQTVLEQSKYGIWEPALSSRLFEDFAGTLCVVPALCVDHEGYRLGYGGGYYDRFLQRYTGLTVTLVYPGFVSHTPLPRETTDRPVDRLITLDIAP
jgi:5-formyltetrahydrofolate cyclo-ligase